MKRHALPSEGDGVRKHCFHRSARAMLNFASFAAAKGRSCVGNLRTLFLTDFDRCSFCVTVLPAAAIGPTGLANRSELGCLASPPAIHAASRQAAESVRPLPAQRHAVLRYHGMGFASPVPHAADAFRRAAAGLGGARLALPHPASRHRDVAVRPRAAS